MTYQEIMVILVTKLNYQQFYFGDRTVASNQHTLNILSRHHCVGSTVNVNYYAPICSAAHKSERKPISASF